MGLAPRLNRNYCYCAAGGDWPLQHGCLSGLASTAARVLTTQNWPLDWLQDPITPVLELWWGAGVPEARSYSGGRFTLAEAPTKWRKVGYLEQEPF